MRTRALLTLAVAALAACAGSPRGAGVLVALESSKFG
jgi:hypothetical protein